VVQAIVTPLKGWPDDCPVKLLFDN